MMWITPFYLSFAYMLPEKQIKRKKRNCSLKSRIPYAIVGPGLLDGPAAGSNNIIYISANTYCSMPTAGYFSCFGKKSTQKKPT